MIKYINYFSINSFQCFRGIFLNSIVLKDIIPSVKSLSITHNYKPSIV